MILAGKGVMAQQRLVGHEQGSEMQIIVIEKIIDQVQVEGFPGGRDLGPLHFKMRRQPVLLLDLPQPDGDLARLVQRAPYRAQYHGFLVVVFQMAGFVAVDINGFAHCAPLRHRHLAVHQHGQEPVAELGELPVLLVVVFDLQK